MDLKRSYRFPLFGRFGTEFVQGKERGKWLQGFHFEIKRKRKLRKESKEAEWRGVFSLFSHGELSVGLTLSSFKPLEY